MSQFRGMQLVELTTLIEEACAGGALQLLKMANVTANVGKTPHLVLAEQLIEAQKRRGMLDG